MQAFPRSAWEREQIFKPLTDNKDFADVLPQRKSTTAPQSVLSIG